MKNINLSRPQRALLDDIIKGRSFVDRHEKNVAQALSEFGLLRVMERGFWSWMVAPTEKGREHAAQIRVGM